MRRLRIGGAALLLAILTIVSSAGPALGWAGSNFSAGDEQLLFTLTNQDRASAGLNALVNDSYLHKEAEWRAKDMATRDFFSHTIPPTGLMVFDYMQKDHYCFKVAGENIGVSSWGDDVATTRIEKAFMKSTSHRENILGSWGRLGVGAYKASDGDKFYAVLFSVPCAAAKPKPTAKLTAKPTTNPTTAPKASPTTTPKANPTTAPTLRTTATPATTPTATVPTATVPTATVPTPTPTAASTATATATEAVALVPKATSAAALPSSLPAYNPPAGRAGPTEDSALSLRVREKAPTQGPLDSLFRMLFGGFFG
jgi:uncharacterized protein YkwD